MKFSLALLKELDACSPGYALGKRLIKKTYPNIKQEDKIDYYEGLRGLTEYIIKNCPENRHWITWFRKMENNIFTIKYYNTEKRFNYFRSADGEMFNNYDDALKHSDHIGDLEIEQLFDNLGINGSIKNVDDSETWIKLDLAINNNSSLFQYYVVYDPETGDNRIANTYLEAAKMYDEEVLKLYKLKQKSKLIYQRVESECGHFSAWDLIYPLENI